MNGSTRFRSLPASGARILLALLLFVCVAGSVVGLGSADLRTEGTDPGRTDLALYSAVASRVAGGEGYYEAVVAEQRARNYPLRPFVTVRLPTLAELIGMVGSGLARLLLQLLAMASAVALIVRLRHELRSKILWAGCAALGASALMLMTVPAMTYWHESWAALLIVLSLACRTRQRWAWSVLFGLIAVLFRELALPYLCLMCTLAALERSRSEALAWAASILLFVAALAAHAWMLSLYLTPSDQHSQGWSNVGGWAFILSMAQHVSLFLFLPLPLVAAGVPLSLLGWAGVRGEMGTRVGLMMSGYVTAFMLIGRPDNFYWGILLAPLLPAGALLSIPALRDLASAAMPRPVVRTSPAAI